MTMPDQPRMSFNVAALLWNAAGDGPCHVYQQGEKLRVGDDVFYPDVMIVCDPAGDDDHMAYAPYLDDEALSPNTTRHDRVRKRAKYQALSSLRAYLIVSQDHRLVERYWRDAPAAPRQREEITAADGRVPVPCPVPGVLAFAGIYRGLIVPDRPPLRRVRDELADEPIETPA